MIGKDDENIDFRVIKDQGWMGLSKQLNPLICTTWLTECSIYIIKD